MMQFVPNLILMYFMEAELDVNGQAVSAILVLQNTKLIKKQSLQSISIFTD